MQFISKLVSVFFAVLMVGVSGIVNAACSWSYPHDCNNQEIIGLISSLYPLKVSSDSYSYFDNDILAPGERAYLNGFEVENPIPAMEDRDIVAVEVTAVTNGKKIDNLVREIIIYANGEKIGSASFENNIANIDIVDATVQRGTVRSMQFVLEGISAEMNGVSVSLKVRLAALGLESQKINMTSMVDLRQYEGTSEARGTYTFKKTVLGVRTDDYSPAGLVGRGVNKPYFIFDIKRFGEDECVYVRSVRFLSRKGLPSVFRPEDVRLSDLITGQVIASGASVDINKGTVDFNIQSLKVCGEIEMALDVTTTQWPAYTVMQWSAQSIEVDGDAGVGYPGDNRFYYMMPVEGSLVSIGK